MPPIGRYPENLQITNQDFADARLNEILKDKDESSTYTFSNEFAERAKEANSFGRDAQSKVLWLFADACDYALQPSNPKNPFTPKWVFSDKRSILPEDFFEDEIAFFTEVLSLITNPWVKARIADTILVSPHSGGVDCAVEAIDAYLEIPLTPTSWRQGGRQCIERAWQLARKLKKGASDRANKIESVLLETFKSTENRDGEFLRSLSQMMLESKMGQSEALNIARRLKEVAQAYIKSKSFLEAAEMFQTALGWYECTKDKDNKFKTLAAWAEVVAQDAESRTFGKKTSYSAARGLYEQVIKIYRMIPKSERPKNGVDHKIDQFRTRLKEAGEKAMEEMKQYSTEIDLRELIESSKDSVRGKQLDEALVALVSLYSGVKYSVLRKSAEEQIRDFPLQATLPASIVSSDGRQIGKRPGLQWNIDESEENQMVVHSVVMQHYVMSLQFIAQGRILPALHLIKEEHDITEEYISDIVKNSPIIPSGRVPLVTKALLLGFQLDFATAIHLIAPQIENLVRLALKKSGVHTTTLDSQGIDLENGLSSLMDKPEIEEIFGDDLAFDIRALFCDQFGPNLRNEIAHGLMDYAACQSQASVYAWWLLFKLVYCAFWHENCSGSA